VFIYIPSLLEDGWGPAGGLQPPVWWFGFW